MSTVNAPETPGLCCPRAKPVDPVVCSTVDPNWSSAMEQHLADLGVV